MKMQLKRGHYLRRIFVTMLALCMLVTLVPAQTLCDRVLAEETGIIDFTNISVSYSETTLTVTDQNPTATFYAYVTWSGIESVFGTTDCDSTSPTADVYSTFTCTNYSSNAGNNSYCPETWSWDSTNKRLKFTVELGKESRGGQYYLSNLQILGESSSGEYENDSLDAGSVTFTRDYSDVTGPTITGVSIDKQGQTISAGDAVTISVQAEDASGLSKECDVDFDCSSDGTWEQRVIFAYTLTYDETSHTYTGTIDTSSLTSKEYAISTVRVYDEYDNFTRVDYNNAGYPYYFRIKDSSGNFAIPSATRTFTFYDRDENDTDVKVFMTKKVTFSSRTALKDIIGTLPTMAKDATLGKFVGWYCWGYDTRGDGENFDCENLITADTEITLQGNILNYYFVPIYEKKCIDYAYLDKNGDCHSKRIVIPCNPGLTTKTEIYASISTAGEYTGRTGVEAFSAWHVYHDFTGETVTAAFVNQLVGYKATYSDYEIAEILIGSDVKSYRDYARLGTTYQIPSTIDGKPVTFSYGYYINPISQVKVVNNTVAVTTEVLYLRFAISTSPYKITYKLNGGKNNSKNPSTYTYNASKAVTLYAPTRAGYVFGGWYSNSNFKTKVSSLSAGTWGNKTLYAKWTKVTVSKAVISSATNKSSRKLVVKWKKISGVKGYQVRYSLKKNMSGAKYTTVTSTSKTISSLSKKKTYYVQVRAYKVDSTGKKVYGAWSSSKKVTIKK